MEMLHRDPQLKNLGEFTLDLENNIYVHPNNCIIDYQDGVEAYILESMKKIHDLSSNSPEFGQYIKDWPSRYHFSKKRTNFLEAVQDILPKNAAVLEIGSGCGTITRWLGEKFQNVDALEGSLQRAIITRYRTKDLKNVEVYCGNLLNTSFGKKYDIITLIGSLEYLPFYDTEHDDPKTVCLTLLTRLYDSLKVNGILLIAIENKFGVKYFSGCKEDHTGKAFEGLIGYPEKTPVTFCHNELESMLSQSGFEHKQFYHVFPDYKLTETIILENSEILSLHPHNWISTPFEDYTGNRLHLYPDTLLLKTITEAGLLWQFSNSYVIVSSKSKDTDLSVKWFIKKYRNDEKLDLKFDHEISLIKKLDTINSGNKFYVKRSPILSGVESCQTDQFEFKLLDNDYINGDLLQYDIVKSLFKTPIDENIKKVIKRLHEQLLQEYSIGEIDSEGFPLVSGDAIDYTFWNLIVTSKNKLCFVDRKWKSKDPLPVDLILFRNCFNFFEKISPFLKNKNKTDFIITYIQNLYPQYSEKRLISQMHFEERFQSFSRGCNQIFSLDSPLQTSVIEQINQSQERFTQIQSLERLLSDKERVIVDLIEHARNLEEIVAVRDNQITEITELSKHAHNLETIVAVRDNQITELSKHAHNLEAIVAVRDNQITELSKHGHDLEAIATDRNNQITELSKHAHNLEAIATDRNNQIAKLSKHAHNLEAIVTDRDNQITFQRQHVSNLEALIANRDNQITLQKQQYQELINLNQTLRNENQSIKQSLTYNLTTKFHKKIVDKLLPQNTRRRNYYHRGLSGSQLLINEGWNRFWQNYLERDFPQALLNVSVIIPTKNAGPDFRYVLEKIKNQKGIASIEIIIVDSGSTDGTCEIAEKYGCRKFSIKPEKFNHGLTRNFGAKHAHGDFIVFLVQDAIPIGDYWLHDMVKILNANNQVAATSCRQVPRSDADLFACYSMWGHYTAMEFFENKIAYCEKDRFNHLSFFEKRKIAGIDDVCSCFKKTIFNRLKFKKLNFAEDLDIGIRLIKKGYKLAFLYSDGVIHSHNRDAEYFLRRYYVDSKSLVEMSNVLSTLDNQDLNSIINSFNVIYLNMKNSLTRLKSQYPDEINVDHFFSELKGNLDSYNFINTTFPEETKLESLLSEIFVLGKPDSVEIKQFTLEFSGILDDFQKYVKNRSDVYTNNELIESSYKLFAIYFGSYLGNRYTQYLTDKTMQSIDTLLKRGV